MESIVVGEYTCFIFGAYKAYVKIFKMAHFTQHSKLLNSSKLSNSSKLLNSHIQLLKERNKIEKKYIVHVIELLLGKKCPEQEQMRLQFFGPALEKDTQINVNTERKGNTERNKILKAICKVVQNGASRQSGVQSDLQSGKAAFQPSEAWWHTIGCQCQDRDCVDGNFRRLFCCIHPRACHCNRCELLRLLRCCINTAMEIRRINRENR